MKVCCLGGAVCKGKGVKVFFVYKRKEAVCKVKSVV